MPLDGITYATDGRGRRSRTSSHIEVICYSIFISVIYTIAFYFIKSEFSQDFLEGTEAFHALDWIGKSASDDIGWIIGAFATILIGFHVAVRSSNPFDDPQADLEVSAQSRVVLARGAVVLVSILPIVWVSLLAYASEPSEYTFILVVLTPVLAVLIVLAGEVGQYAVPNRSAQRVYAKKAADESRELLKKIGEPHDTNSRAIFRYLSSGSVIVFNFIVAFSAGMLMHIALPPWSVSPQYLALMFSVELMSVFAILMVFYVSKDSASKVSAVLSRIASGIMAVIIVLLCLMIGALGVSLFPRGFYAISGLLPLAVSLFVIVSSSLYGRKFNNKKSSSSVAFIRYLTIGYAVMELRRSDAWAKKERSESALKELDKLQPPEAHRSCSQ